MVGSSEGCSLLIGVGRGVVRGVVRCVVREGSSGGVGVVSG